MARRADHQRRPQRPQPQPAALARPAVADRPRRRAVPAARRPGPGRARRATRSRRSPTTCCCPCAGSITAADAAPARPAARGRARRAVTRSCPPTGSARRRGRACTPTTCAAGWPTAGSSPRPRRPVPGADPVHLRDPAGRPQRRARRVRSTSASSCSAASAAFWACASRSTRSACARWRPAWIADQVRAHLEGLQRVAAGRTRRRGRGGAAPIRALRLAGRPVEHDRAGRPRSTPACARTRRRRSTRCSRVSWPEPARSPRSAQQPADRSHQLRRLGVALGPGLAPITQCWA